MGLSTINEESAAIASVEENRSVARALERAALRELKSRKREQYAREDAEDAAILAKMRAERIAADDAGQAENWQMNVDRELAIAEGRACWVDQHVAAAEMRREVRGEQRKMRADGSAEEERRVEELRARRNAAQDEYSRSVWQMDVERELAVAALRDTWSEAFGLALEAKKAYKQAMREARREAAKNRPARIAADKAAREERLRKEEARGEALRAAIKESFYATTLRRDAERAGAPAEEIERLRASEAELKRIEENLRASIRAERLAEEDERVRAIAEEGKDKVFQESLIREEWLLRKHIATLEFRRAREAGRAVRNAAVESQAGLRASLREERNAICEAAKEEERCLFTEREMRLAELQEGLTAALEAEHAELRRVKALEREARPAIRAAEAAEVARRREAKLERENLEFETFRQMAKERAYDRSLERDAAIASAQVAYKAMCGNMDEQGLK